MPPATDSAPGTRQPASPVSMSAIETSAPVLAVCGGGSEQRSRDPRRCYHMGVAARQTHRVETLAAGSSADCGAESMAASECLAA